MRKNTIQDVAKKAQVGVGTVSRVLNNHPSVRGSTRERVLSAMSELHYSPNPHARRIAGGRSYTVSVMLPMVSVEFYTRLVVAIEETLTQNRFDMALFPLLGKARTERYLSSNRMAYQADGILMFTYDLAQLFENQRLPTEHPVVLIDGKSDAYDCVFLDNYSGGWQAALHACNFEGSIYFLNALDDPESAFPNTVFVERKRGFQEGLAQQNKTYKREYLCPLHHQGGLQAALHLLDEAELPCTVFAAADILAVSVMEEAQRRGLSIGRDIKIIGFDDQPWAKDVGLTTLHQPIETMGKQAAEMLLERLNGWQGEPRKICHTPHLIERATTSTGWQPAKLIAISER